MLGVGADTILGSAASRFTIDDAIPGIMSKAVDNFFHINGLNAWTRVCPKTLNGLNACTRVCPCRALLV